jgi:hypothetical protein
MGGTIQGDCRLCDTYTDIDPLGYNLCQNCTNILEENDLDATATSYADNLGKVLDKL